MSDLSHLSKAAQAAMELSDEERINKILMPRWIGYTRAKTIMAKLEDLLVYPKKDRMPNLLIIGETNSGKTMIVKRFAKSHPAYDNPGLNGITVPVLYVQSPPKPDVNRFYNIILTKLFAPFKARDHISVKEPQVISVLQRIGLRILIIDEIQDILAGHLDKQREFLDTIRFLSNELMLPIVGVGTKSALRALQTNPPLANRFEPAPLPRWHMDDEFLMLLASFERVLPLREPSDLQEISLATQLLSMCEGNIGALSNLLDRAAIHAIKTGVERINKKVLDKVDWTMPSEVKKKVERLV